ncbi:hypothetical protein [Chondromyces crocatus]|uniref:Uncharacterized protein n=1 Tax=Chondromyces crocatus TaxID=52 RepID=A0A0K1EBN1_CHOCO|nr:hypothetical protein [Chondromyces crocatus]AKT38275.1 uncharacterized protein CMC5_024180 [Chondromyces crocatus]
MIIKLLGTLPAEGNRRLWAMTQKDVAGALGFSSTPTTAANAVERYS